MEQYVVERRKLGTCSRYRQELPRFLKYTVGSGGAVFLLTELLGSTPAFDMSVARDFIAVAAGVASCAAGFVGWLDAFQSKRAEKREK